MRAAFVAVVLTSLIAGRAHAQTPPPVEAFGRLPAIAAAAISPDGSRVALALSDARGQSSVAIVNLDNASASKSFAVAEGEQLRDVSWADDRRVSYFISRTFRPGQVLPPGYYFRGGVNRVDYFRTGLIDVQTDRVVVITTNERSGWADIGSTLIAPIEGDPGTARLIGNENGVARMYRVDLSNGRVFAATPRGSNEDTLGWEIDETGSAFVRYDSDERTNRWRVFLYENDQPRLLMEDVSEFGEPISVEGLLPDGRLVVNERPEGAAFYGLYVVDRSNGVRTPLFQHESGDVQGAWQDPYTRRIVGVVWSGDGRLMRFFDPELQAVDDRVHALLEGAFVDIISWSRDRGRFLLYAERGLDGGGYYLFDRADDRIRQLGLRYPELQGAADMERQAITYRARDGVRVPAYLTYPAGAERRNLPLVLLVHGGPHARDTFFFDWWSAFLASRGYAVLQPNYRGSTGLGEAWEEAGKRQWGGLMQTDVEDGVAALVRGGIVDPARVCIVGASYGGYAALAGATLTPDRYRCAASIAGVSDLELMLTLTARQTGGRRSMPSDWWRSSIGDRAEDRERIRAVSPANLVNRVQIPVLLMHGTDDTVVPIEQTRRMRDRLQSAGKNVRYVELAGDDHWLSDAATRTQMLRELDTFLAQHLRGGSVTVNDSGAPAATPQ